MNGGEHEGKITGFALCAFFLGLSFPVQGQQPAEKIPRIGTVTGSRNESGSITKTFRQALQDLGYFEGKNILFEQRYTEGDRDRVPAIVAELMGLKIDFFSRHKRL